MHSHFAKDERRFLQDIRSILILGLPLIGSQVAQFLLHMTDTIMVGRYGLEELAALTLASSYWFVLFILMAGAAFAVMPIVATAKGQGDQTTIRRATRMAFWISIMVSVIFYPFFLYGDKILVLLGQEPELAKIARPYLLLTGVEILPALIIAVMRSYFSALEKTRFVFFMTFGAVILNIPLNWLLIYGNLGFPELGVFGAGLSSMIVSFLAIIALFTYAQIATPENQLLKNPLQPDWIMFSKLLKMGVPIGITSLAEIGFFTASTVMVGWIDTVSLAAHGIVIQISSLTFMVQIGLSQAGTIRAGNAYGSGDRLELRKGAWGVTVLSAGFAVIATILFVIGPQAFLGLFLSPLEPAREQVLLLGTTLLFFAGLMQLSDGGQQVTLGCLRGVHDTTIPMWLASVSYWLIGAPACYILAFPLGLGAVGVWIGFIIGLSMAWILMAWRFWAHKSKI